MPILPSVAILPFMIFHMVYMPTYDLILSSLDLRLDDSTSSATIKIVKTYKHKFY